MPAASAASAAMAPIAMTSEPTAEEVASGASEPIDAAAPATTESDSSAPTSAAAEAAPIAADEPADASASHAAVADAPLRASASDPAAAATDTETGACGLLSKTKAKVNACVTQSWSIETKSDKARRGRLADQPRTEIPRCRGHCRGLPRTRGQMLARHSACWHACACNGEWLLVRLLVLSPVTDTNTAASSSEPSAPEDASAATPAPVHSLDYSTSSSPPGADGSTLSSSFNKTLQSHVNDALALSLLRGAAACDSVFGVFGGADLERLARCLSVLRCDSGERIITAGEQASFCGIVLGQRGRHTNSDGGGRGRGRGGEGRKETRPHCRPRLHSPIRSFCMVSASPSVFLFSPARRGHFLRLAERHAADLPDAQRAGGRDVVLGGRHPHGRHRRSARGRVGGCGGRRRRGGWRGGRRRSARGHQLRGPAEAAAGRRGVGGQVPASARGGQHPKAEKHA